jgi:hypothetical protein
MTCCELVRTTVVLCLASCVQLLALYVLGGLAGSCTHLAYCWYDAGGERPASYLQCQAALAYRYGGHNAINQRAW